MAVEEEEESFWTTGKIIALAAVGGGLFVALTVVLVVSLVRPEEKIVVASEPPQAPAAPARTGVQVKGSAVEKGAVKGAAGKAAKGAAVEKGSAVEKGAVKGAAKGAAGKTAKGAASKTAKARAKPRVVMQKVKVAPRKVYKPSHRQRRPVKKKEQEKVDYDDLLGVGSPSAKTKKPSQDEVDDLLAVAPRPRTKPAPRAATKAQPGGGALPLQPTKASIQAAMRSVLPRIRSCHDKHQQTGTIRVSMTIRGNGTAELTSSGPSPAPPPGSVCWAPWSGAPSRASPASR